MADPHRVLRRRRGPLQLALGGVLVALVLVVEVLIVQAYVNVNRSTAIFGQVTFLTGNLVNVQREALLPTTSMPPRSAGPARQPALPAGGARRRRRRRGHRRQGHP